MKYLGCMTDAATTGNLPEPYAVTPGASPYTFTATQRGQMFVEGGTVSAISFTRNSSHSLSATSGTVSMSPGDKLTVTYSVAPTLTYIPL